MTTQPIRNVVFDMGGVLLKWEPLYYARRFSENDEDAALLAQAVFGSAEWAQQDTGALEADTIAWIAAERLPERLHANAADLAHRWWEKRTFIPDMDQLIEDLKRAGYGIYLLSNAGTSFERYMRTLPGFGSFDGMVVSCYEHVVKPNPAIYRILLERYGLHAGDCLFVDDTLLNVKGAQRVGMLGWHFADERASAAALRVRLL
jgi:epoxide hydrolase-like predicted phosphatase